MESRLYVLVREELEAMGWKLDPSPYALGNGFARAYAIIRQGNGHPFQCGADPRSGGGSAVI